MGGDVHRPGRYPRAWWKVMAAYCRVYGFGHLRADCRGPGSAPEPYARFEYGTTVAFTAFDVMLQFATIQVTRLV